MNIITKALYYLAITFITFQFSAIHALNPLFDEVNYPDNLHTKSKTSQARFMFRMAHQLDMLAIKKLHLRGEKEEALILLSKAKLIYTKASALWPDNAMIKIYAEAHDYLNQDGSIIRGNKDAKLALSNIYDDDDNETPIDPEMKAFWLGKGLKIEKDPDLKAENHHHKDAKKDDEDSDADDKTTSVVDGRMASLFVLGAATGAGGLEMGKYLTENVALQYLSGGGGFVVGFIAYVIAIKTMTCISSNRTETEKIKKAEELVTRLESLLDKKSSSHHSTKEDNDEPCISCNCHRPSCSCFHRWFCCCCCHTKMHHHGADADDYLENLGSSENPLYGSPPRGHNNPLFSDESPKHEQDTPLSSLHSLQLTNDNELKELTEIYQERLMQYGPNDPFVLAFCKQTKEIRQEASDALTKKYTPPNSEEASLEEVTKIDPDRPEHIAIDIQELEKDLDSADTEISAQENAQ